MTDSLGVVYDDSITIVLNAHAYRLLKWSLVRAVELLVRACDIGDCKALPFIVSTLAVIATLAVGSDRTTDAYVLKF
jgi:hypothetical protein